MQKKYEKGFFFFCCIKLFLYRLIYGIYECPAMSLFDLNKSRGFRSHRFWYVSNHQFLKTAKKKFQFWTCPPFYQVGYCGVIHRKTAVLVPTKRTGLFTYRAFYVKTASHHTRMLRNMLLYSSPNVVRYIHYVKMLAKHQIRNRFKHARLSVRVRSVGMHLSMSFVHLSALPPSYIICVIKFLPFAKNMKMTSKKRAENTSAFQGFCLLPMQYHPLLFCFHSAVVVCQMYEPSKFFSFY